MEQQQQADHDEHNSAKGVPLAAGFDGERFRITRRHSRGADAGGWGRGIGRSIGRWLLVRAAHTWILARIRVGVRPTWDRASRGRGEASHVRGRGRRGSHPQPGSQIVEPERIGKWQSIAPRLGGLGGVKDLIEDPGSDQQTEDKALIGKADEHGKNEYVGQGLDELPVVHRAYPGNETQETGQDWVGMYAGQV